MTKAWLCAQESGTDPVTTGLLSVALLVEQRWLPCCPGEGKNAWVAEVTHPPCGLTPGVSCPFVANSALGGLVWSRMGEQMQQIREEVCSWVALAIWQALAEEGEERMAEGKSKENVGSHNRLNAPVGVCV